MAAVRSSKMLMSYYQTTLRHIWEDFNHLTPELNPSAQSCLTRFFTGDFASWTLHFINICEKNQQIHHLFFQFIN
jgi:hypothetical protein